MYDDWVSYLGDDRQFGAQVVKSDFTNHLVVNDDGSGCSFNDAEQSQRHGWLASASPTDYPDLRNETLLGKSWIIDLPTWLCTLPILSDNHKATARFDGVPFNLLRLFTHIRDVIYVSISRESITPFYPTGKHIRNVIYVSIARESHHLAFEKKVILRTCIVACWVWPGWREKAHKDSIWWEPYIYVSM